ncbi:MAG TPA: hypothetical protein VMB53_02875 [Gaiellaceae bacterium]|nr:hypothetical protein [Gaiellaceae bacterium]
MPAEADAVVTVTATAAATETGPPEVVADGVEAPPPEPPAADAVESAKLLWFATWLSTPPGGTELEVPVDDAVAVPFVVEVPAAVMLAAPVTVSERNVVAPTR